MSRARRPGKGTAVPVGRLRRLVLLTGVLGAGAIIGARVAQLQAVQGEHWRNRAEAQHASRKALPAPRGTIFDRDGVPLAVSQEAFRISVAPRELRDPDAAADALVEALGVSRRRARRAVDPARTWAVLPGRYGAPVRERLADLRGVYFERVLERFHPHGQLGLEVLGRLSGDGRPLGGVEQELDSLLRGQEGSAVVRRDAAGRAIPGAELRVAEPVAGNDVVLTIDVDLQEIAHEALADAVAAHEARGGDLLLVDPWTGDIVAAASRQSDGNRHWTGVTDPFEPGSTLKPFTVATLLSRGRASMTDSVYAEEGVYTSRGRTIRDIHGYEWLTVHDALRYSSNVALAKLSTLLERGEQYSGLRAFGFGSPTGVPYPSEASGTLRRPARWSAYTAASLAIGYEVAVTPLQLAMAYATLANGGTLVEPRLTREVRRADGKSVRSYDKKRIRRVIDDGVADEVTAALADAVRDGTGTKASLGDFVVAGKTGTARRSDGGSYRAGAYTATFVGFFPAVDPQLVVLVKLDEPGGDTYYGGSTAAPVSRETLAALLAARAAPIDRRPLARTADAWPAEGVRVVTAAAVASPGAVRGPAAGEPGAARSPFVLALNAPPPRRMAGAEAPRIPVPEVAGLSVRDAARRLHAVGLQVLVEGEGTVRGTRPAAGDGVAPGTPVRLLARVRR
ncbi:MAG: penicillin-binding transpeptidase domain-containing protein [Gemmatimonadota bacterium]